MTPPKPTEIKAARKAAKLTQARSAAILGFSLRGWKDLEYGHRPMRRSLFDMFVDLAGRSKNLT